MTWTLLHCHDVINDSHSQQQLLSRYCRSQGLTVEGNDSESEKVAGTFNVSVEDSGELSEDIHCLGLTSAVSIPARVRKAMVQLPHPWLTAPRPEGEGNEPLPAQEEGESDGQEAPPPVRTFLQSGESGSGGQEWGSSSHRYRTAKAFTA